MLADGRIAGDMRLDIPAAERVVGELGAALGLSAQRTAAGVLSIVVASMANAIRTVTVQKGIDPRDGHLVAYGAQGPSSPCHWHASSRSTRSSSHSTPVRSRPGASLHRT